MNERNRRGAGRPTQTVITLWLVSLTLALLLGAQLVRESRQNPHADTAHEGDDSLAVAIGEEEEEGHRPEDLYEDLERETATLASSALGELRAHLPGEREERERPLKLASHRATVRIVGNVARTEIEETFRNDGRETLEGVYRFPLPSDAQIASLALEVDGRWEEGAFVERSHGRKIWRGVIRQATPTAQRKKEEFIWVPGPWQDPALLEWQAGGRVELRIYPIPGRGERRVRLAYTQTLPPHGEGRKYVYPLARAADDSMHVERFELFVEASTDAHAISDPYRMPRERTDRGGTRFSFAAERFAPTGDIVIEAAEPEPRGALRHWTFVGGASAPPPETQREDRDALEAHRALYADRRPYVLFALRPDLPVGSAPRAQDHVLVVDSSQSMVGERHAKAVALAEAFVGTLPPGARVAVLVCDLECNPFSPSLELASVDLAKRVRAFLESTRPAGASNLARAIERAVTFAPRQSGKRIVYIGDGMASAGPRRPGSLGAEMRALLRDDPELSIHTVGVGSDADAATLAEIARAGRGTYVPFTPGRSRGETVRALLAATSGAALTSVTLELPEGVEEAAPHALPTILPGQELLVSARLRSQRIRGEVKLRGELAGRPYEAIYPVDLEASEARGNAFVPRQWALASIEAHELRGEGSDLPRIVALSKAYGVLSRHTSLLVLESEAMFRAFGVDRREAGVTWTGDDEMDTGIADEILMTDSGGGMALRADVGSYGAPARMAAPPAPAPAASAAEPQRASAAKRSARSESAEFEGAPMPPADTMPVMPDRELRRPGGRWMREVVYREGTIHPNRAASAVERRALATAEAALRENPDSRDRHRALVRALSRAGEVERAVEEAERWLERDPLDPEALTYLADALGRLGHQREALRVLSGIVDLAPTDDVLHQRLAHAFARADMPVHACAHHVTRAENDPRDAEKVASAVRCERSLGRVEPAERLLALVPSNDVREIASRRAQGPEPRSNLRGELMLDATWSGTSDLDLSIVTPQGTRLSWMGGRVQVVGEQGRSGGRERLGLQRISVGSYRLEIARTDPHDRRPISGRVDVQILGRRQTLPFVLDGARAELGRIDVQKRTRLEPAVGPR